VKSLTQPRIFISYCIGFCILFCQDAIAQCSVNAGPDLARCLNQSVALGAGLTYTGQAPLTFNWSGSISDVQNPIFSATNALAGTYTVTVTDANGCVASDDIVLAVNPLPTVNAGADVSICPGTPTNLCATASSANGAISYYIWMGGPLTQCRTVSPTSTPPAYSVTVTDAAGCQATDAVQVTVLPAPGANAGADQTICLGNGAVQLTGTPSGGTWSGTGVSNSGLFTPSAVGTTTSNYTNTGSNGCISSDQMSITVTNPNPPDGGTDVSVCLNSSPFQLPQVGSWNGSPFVTAGGVFTPSQGGSYNLFVSTTSGGCNVSDIVVVNVLILPVINAGADQAICIGQAANFNATATTTNGTISGLAWTGGWVSNASILNPTASPTTNTTYTLTATDAAGCISNDQIAISVNPYPTVNAGIDQTLCVNTPATQMLNATPSGGTWTGTSITSGGLYTPSSIGQFTVTYTYTNAAGCAGSDTKVITVIAPGAVDAGDDYVLCQGGPTVMLTNGGTWSGSSFVQSNGVFNPAQVGTYSLTYSTTSGGCAATDQIQIQVIGLPSVNAGSDAAICVNQNYSLNATASSINGAITSTLWTGLNIQTPSSLNSIVSPTATSIYELTVLDAAGCSATDQVTITVNTLPTVNAGSDVLICSNAGASTLNGYSPTGGVWSGPQVNASGIFTPAFDGDYTLTYVYSAPSGCSSYDTRVVTVVSPLPVNAGPDLTLCEDVPSINLAAGGFWSGSALVNASGVFIPSQPGSYNLTYTTLSNGCNITDQINIVVLTLPNANAGTDISACIGSSVNLIGVASNSPNGNITNFAWSNGATGSIPSIQVNSNQNIVLTITDAAGCTDTDQVSVTALALPTVYAGTDVTLCNQPSPYTLTDYAPAGGTWTGPGVTSNGIYTPSGTGNFVLNYCVVGANGCQACDQLTVQVNAAPANNAGADIQVCQQGGQVQLSPITSGGTWTGTGVTSGGLFTPGPANNYILAYTIGSGYCQVTDHLMVTVHANPTATVPSTYQVCEGNSIAIQVVASGGLPPYNYAWSDDNILSDDHIANPTATPVADQNITATVTDVRGCVANASTNLDVLAWPQASFEIPATGCQNAAIAVVNTSQNAGNYSWSFGNSEASLVVNPSVDYNLPGFYQVQLTATNILGCSDQSVHSIEIIGMPTASFNMSAIEGCSPFTPNIENTSSGAGLTHQWLIGGSFSYVFEPSNLSFVTEEVVNIQPISLTTSNQCGSDTETIQVMVNPRPIAQFATNLSSQCSPVTTEYLNLSAGNATDYFWDLGDGQTTNSNNPFTNVYVTEEQSADFVIQLIATNACGSDSTESIVHVLPNTVQIGMEPSVTSGCTPLFVNFNNTTTGANNYYFDFDNGEFSIAQNPNFVFDTPGVYDVRMIADDGCSYDTTTITLQITASPSLVIGSDISAGCPGSEIHFFSSTIGNITHIDWTFGDGATATEENPAHAFQNQSDYLISATAFDYNGCTAGALHNIEIYPLPEPVIALQNIEACSPWQVCPENNSINADNFHWDSGSGLTSDDELPCFTFVNGTNSPVQRTLSLTAVSPDGCSASTTLDIQVLPQPELVMALNEHESCLISQPVVTQLVANAADEFQWYVNDLAASNEQSPVFGFDAVGNYEINVVVFNTFGCTNEATSLYEIHPLPAIDIMPEVMNGCPPLVVQFDNSTENGATWAWTATNGATSTDMYPTMTFETTGQYDVQLVATSSFGCQSVQVYEDLIEVYPTPFSNFSFEPNDEVIYEVDVQFNNLSQGAVEYQWNFDDGNYSNIVSPMHEFPNGGLYVVTLTAQNEFGCTDKHIAGVNIDNTFFTFMPNAFTPDSDGINDSFGPVFSSTEEIKTYRFYVKNKWGEIIFETDDPQRKWNGNNKGQGYYLHTDIFTWVIQLEFTNKQLNKTHEGTVTLIR
jgi:large repetitive protein